MDEGELVFLPIFFAQVAPITAGMPPKEVAGLFAGLLERSESTGCGDDLTESKLLCHLASQKWVRPKQRHRSTSRTGFVRNPNHKHLRLATLFSDMPGDNLSFKIGTHWLWHSHVLG